MINFDNKAKEIYEIAKKKGIASQSTGSMSSLSVSKIERNVHNLSILAANFET